MMLILLGLVFVLVLVYCPILLVVAVAYSLVARR